jgi:competence protein ComEA
VPSFTLTRAQAIAAAAAALAAVFLAARFFGGHPAGSSPESELGNGSTASIPALTTPTGASPTEEPAGAAESVGAAEPVGAEQPGGVVVVDVTGAVRRPGVYRLRQGARIAEAISRAGGMTRHADSSLVNLAAPLADGEQVLVPARVGAGGGGVGGDAGSAGASPASPVDLNTATVEQLDALPGIGPVTAQKIVDYRTQHGPFTSVDDLDAIPGIGPARIANLKGLVIP